MPEWLYHIGTQLKRLRPRTVATLRASCPSTHSSRPRKAEDRLVVPEVPSRFYWTV